MAQYNTASEIINFFSKLSSAHSSIPNYPMFSLSSPSAGGTRGACESLTMQIQRRPKKYIPDAAKNGSPNHVSPRLIPMRNVVASSGPATKAPIDCTTAMEVYKIPI